MKISCLIAITASLTVSATAFAASDAETLFKQYNCNMCHTMDSASLGPSLKDIASKYATVKDAQAQLEAKVRHGGKGSFGSMPMPATPNSVSDKDIEVIVHWILTQK